MKIVAPFFHEVLFCKPEAAWQTLRSLVRAGGSEVDVIRFMNPEFVEWIEEHAPSAMLKASDSGIGFGRFDLWVTVQIDDPAEALHYKMKWYLP